MTAEPQCITGSMHIQEKESIQRHGLLGIILEFSLSQLGTSRLTDAFQFSTHTIGVVSEISQSS